MKKKYRTVLIMIMLQLVVSAESRRLSLTQKTKEKRTCLWGVSIRFRCSTHFTIFQKVSATAEKRVKIERILTRGTDTVMIMILQVVISACVDDQVHHTMGNETADLTFRLGSYLVVNSIWVKLVISYCENGFAFEQRFELTQYILTTLSLLISSPLKP